MKSVEVFMIASFGMTAYKQFEAGKNGVFIVLPSGRPDCWKHYRWYTPLQGDRKNYGNWSFLKDGATNGNGVVENWFELLESWFDVPGEAGGTNAPGDTKQEVEKLQGEWTLVSLERRGKKAGDETVKRSKLKIEADQWTVTLFERQENTMTMTARLDPSKDPKSIVLTPKAGNMDDMLGIYMLEGDLLRLCFATQRGDIEPPQAFKAEEGMLMVWRRATK